MAKKPATRPIKKHNLTQKQLEKFDKEFGTNKSGKGALLRSLKKWEAK